MHTRRMQVDLIERLRPGAERLAGRILSNVDEQAWEAMLANVELPADRDAIRQPLRDVRKQARRFVSYRVGAGGEGTSPSRRVTCGWR